MCGLRGCIKGNGTAGTADISEARWTEVVVDQMWEVTGSEHLGKACSLAYLLPRISNSHEFLF